MTWFFINHIIVRLLCICVFVSFLLFEITCLSSFFFIQHIVILKYSYIRGPLSLVSPGTHKISGLVLMPCQPPCPHRETQVAPHTPCPSRLSSSPYLWFIVLYFVVCFVEGFMVLGVRCFEFVCWLCDC